MLYENRVRSEAEDQGLSEEEIKACVDALKSFYESIDTDPKTKKHRHLRPSPYYALLLGDGDNMGKVVDAQETTDQHRTISRKLSTFAGEAKKIVGKHQGYTIYAGGDDVMAFVPLHTLLDCAEELHAAFKAAVGEYKSGPKDGPVVSPSLSIGVVIAHHLEPLSDVLALARGAEKAAKNHKGKNALAITLSKRSGADRTIVGGWKEGIAERIALSHAAYCRGRPRRRGLRDTVHEPQVDANADAIEKTHRSGDDRRGERGSRAGRETEAKED